MDELVELYLIWKVPDEDHFDDVGDFHDCGIFPTGELMAFARTHEGAEDVIDALEDASPSDRFGETMDDAPYEFTVSCRDVPQSVLRS